MKHLKGWSFRDLERELRRNLVYRRFTHFDAEITPDFTVFSRSFALLSPALTAEIHQRVLSLACEHGVAQGQKLRSKISHSFAESRGLLILKSAMIVAEATGECSLREALEIVVAVHPNRAKVHAVTTTSLLPIEQTQQKPVSQRLQTATAEEFVRFRATLLLLDLARSRQSQ
jgi:IS5 family transposase